MTVMVQARETAFGRERMLRYGNALERQPAARYLEVLPLLCLCARPEVRNWDVVDIGSGTGYLADFFEGVARSVVRVDKSFAGPGGGRGANSVASDMRDVSRALGSHRADLVVSLGAFHHNHEPEFPRRDRIFPTAPGRQGSPERFVDAAATRRRHRETLTDWHRLLKPGGMLILVDVPGLPDPRWTRFLDRPGQGPVDTRGYHRAMLDRVSDWHVPFDAEVLGRFFGESRRGFWACDPHMAEVRRLHGCRPTMKNLVDSCLIPREALRQQGPMLTTDFFDRVVHENSITGHNGYFARESWMRRTLEDIGMEDVRAETIPTPWLFPDERTAAWFVHELFSLGEEWEAGALFWPGQETVAGWLEDFLGFFRDSYGRLMLNWQLEYVVARKPRG